MKYDILSSHLSLEIGEADKKREFVILCSIVLFLCVGWPEKKIGWSFLICVRVGERGGTFFLCPTFSLLSVQGCP